MEKNIEFFLRDLIYLHPELRPVFLLILKKHYQKVNALESIKEKLISNQTGLMQEIQSIRSETNDIMECLKNIQKMIDQ